MSPSFGQQSTLLMPLHLIVSEVSLRLIWIAFSFALTWLASFVCGETLLFCVANIQGNPTFCATTLTEALNTYIACASSFAFLYSVPLCFYHLWCFVVPSQTQTQRHSFARVIAFSLASLVCLIWLTYLFLLPHLCHFCAYFAQTSSNALQIQLFLKISDFVRLCSQIVVCVAFLSQLPIALFICSVNGWNYARYRRVVGVSCLLLGAFLAPPDLLSQLLISACVFLACEIAFWFSMFEVCCQSDPYTTHLHIFSSVG